MTHPERPKRARVAGNDDQAVPQGTDFLDLVWAQEDGCEAVTDSELQRLGQKAPACLEEMGTVLSLTDRMASCWWECRGGDHVVEYLCGRVASNARAALRLTRFGFYDEALLCCRSMGETANLLQLFCLKTTSLSEWKSLTRKKRMNLFGPARVRTALEDLGLDLPPLINEKRYRRLCERSAHVHPATKPQAHNLLGVPNAGASFQEAGSLLCLNEIALPLASAALFAGRLLDLQEKVTDRINSAVRRLVAEIGGFTILTEDEYYAEQLSDPGLRAELIRAIDEVRLKSRQGKSRE